MSFYFYWNFQIKEGKKIIIAAHGNSLRGIVKHLDNMSNDEIMGLNLPTGIPFVYKLDENMKPIESMKVSYKCYFYHLKCKYSFFAVFR